jgi:hypothetical protein
VSVLQLQEWCHCDFTSFVGRGHQEKWLVQLKSAVLFYPVETEQWQDWGRDPVVNFPFTKCQAAGLAVTIFLTKSPSFSGSLQNSCRKEL